MNIIELNKLTKFYGKICGIKDVSFNVTNGEIFGFIGPNGAGKSTTIRTLLNFLFPSSGSAKIFGLDIVKNSEMIKKRIGYLPAESNYYDNMTVRELMDYSASFYNIKDFENRLKYLTDSLDLDIQRKINDLSSGNKKKVSIVQSLLHNPDLLILDEPTSGLDPLVQSAFYEILQEENKKGVTIFFSSHILSEVQRICDRVAIIRQGKIIKVESIENMKKNLLKNVHISFTETSPDCIDIQGVVKYQRSKKEIRFLFDGDINELTACLSKYKIENIAIEDPNLDEIFLHFYKNHEENNDK
ncbi:ABC transporter ATP-binding protein [Bacteroidetes/Chlorobi group bacterium ChocPot_Mid]|nr:MAG: ABC transporter ATP-binding protein [Bacteroidetes/Chlorobi group bacterium ChocPot_Mid]